MWQPLVKAASRQARHNYRRRCAVAACVAFDTDAAQPLRCSFFVCLCLLLFVLLQLPLSSISSLFVSGEERRRDERDNDRDYRYGFRTALTAPTVSNFLSHFFFRPSRPACTARTTPTARTAPTAPTARTAPTAPTARTARTALPYGTENQPFLPYGMVRVRYGNGTGMVRYSKALSFQFHISHSMLYRLRRCLCVFRREKTI